MSLPNIGDKNEGTKKQPGKTKLKTQGNVGCLAIILTNAGLLLIGDLGIVLSEI